MQLKLHLLKIVPISLRHALHMPNSLLQFTYLRSLKLNVSNYYLFFCFNQEILFYLCPRSCLLHLSSYFPCRSRIYFFHVCIQLPYSIPFFFLPLFSVTSALYSTLVTAHSPLCSLFCNYFSSGYLSFLTHPHRPRSFLSSILSYYWKYYLLLNF